MKYLFTTILLFFYLISNAADSTFSWVAWKKTWLKEPLLIKSLSLAASNGVSNSAEVIDMRSDTSCLGLDISRDNIPHCIVVEKGLSNWINFDLSSNQINDQLLLVVKSFWINEVNTFFYRDTDGRIHIDNIPVRQTTTFALLTKLTCKVDVFFKNQDNYQPLVRIDTVLIRSQKAQSSREPLAAEILTILRSKISEAISLGRYKNKSAVSKPVIMDSYSKTYKVPILNDSFIRKGIYYSWDQFKQNRPDTITYNIQYLKSEQPQIFAKNSNGLETVMQEGFALYDGTKLYKLDGGYVFDMYRDGNAFYSMEVSDAKVKKKFLPLAIPLPGATIGGSESLGVSVKFKMSPYLINSEIGEEY